MFVVNKEKLLALDGLRGWMALWVWITHVVTMATLPLVKTHGIGVVLANGQYAVCVFILLSGFVISNSATTHSWKDFIIRRGFRLFPAYLICLAISVLIVGLSIELIKATPWPMMRIDDRLEYLQDSLAHFWPHLGLHVLLLHGLVPDSILSSTSYAFMGQAWSLTLEWQYYLMAGLLMKLSFKSRSLVFELAVLIVLLMMAKVFTQPSFIASYLWLFYVGHLFWKHFDQHALWRYAIYFTVCLVMGAKSLAILIFGLTVYSSFHDGRLKHFLENRVSLFLGKVSYGFYCVYMIAIFLTGYVLVVILKLDSRVLYAVLLISLSLVFSLLLSALLSRTVEQPMIQYARKITASRPR